MVLRNTHQRRLILTAGHCFDVDVNGWTFPHVNGTNAPITSQQAALEMTANFNFQNDPNGNPRPEEVVNVTALVEHRLTGLDFAVLRIQRPTVARVSTALAGGDVSVGTPLTIIGHPQGKPKMVEGGTLSGIVGSGTSRRLHDGDIDTLGGNSGSGILSALGLLVGVHVEGGCTSTGGANRGVPIADILKASSLLRNLGRPGVYFADVNHDLRADALVINENRVTVRRSSSSGGFSGNEAWTSNPYYGLRGTSFADVDGDGRADAIVVNDNRVTVRRRMAAASARTKRGPLTPITVHGARSSPTWTGTGGRTPSW